MTAEFWLQLSAPLATLWGVSPQTVSGLFGLFTIIVITAVICLKTNNKEIGLPGFLMLMFLGAMIGIIDWIVFTIVIVIGGALFLKFGHSGAHV